MRSTKAEASTHLFCQEGQIISVAKYFLRKYLHEDEKAFVRLKCETSFKKKLRVYRQSELVFFNLNIIDTSGSLATIKRGGEPAAQDGLGPRQAVVVLRERR